MGALATQGNGESVWCLKSLGYLPVADHTLATATRTGDKTFSFLGIEGPGYSTRQVVLLGKGWLIMEVTLGDGGGNSVTYNHRTNCSIVGYTYV